MRRYQNFWLSHARHNACTPNNQLSVGMGRMKGPSNTSASIPRLCCPRALKQRRRSMSASNSHIPRLDQGYLICVEVSERTSTDATSASYNLYCRDACWLRISYCVFAFQFSKTTEKGGYKLQLPCQLCQAGRFHSI